MSSTTHKTERLHSLDSLRAIMMMLGIVLHASIAYVGGEPSYGWPTRDPNVDSGFLLWLLLIIHNFRMPIFMFIAGFFAALLFYERSPGRMMQNRFSRLVLPFIVFILLLWPLCTMAFSYSNQLFGYTGTIDSAVGSFYKDTTLATFTDFRNLIPASTMHLWFIYYLIMFSVASFSLGLLFKKMPKVSEILVRNTEELIKSPVKKFIVFAGINFFILYAMGKSWVNLSIEFLPDWGTFIFYFYFYIAGWALFKAKKHLECFMDFAWTYTIVATVIFTAYFHTDDDILSTEIQGLIKSVIVWMFLFGFTGLFIRYFSNHSAKMRYISDSAYWVYLLHLPLAAVIPGLIGNWPLPGLIKFLIVVTGTLAVCMGTYHLLVRRTLIGQFLNGKKYTGNIREIADTDNATISEVKVGQ